MQAIALRPGSARAPGFEALRPMRAVTAAALPRSDAGHAYEFKWDGYRALARAGKGPLRLMSRTGLDLTPKYPALAGLARQRDPVILDGEVVALHPQTGLPDFGRLQNAGREAAAVHFFAFDILAIAGRSAMHEPYSVRRELLEGLGLEGPAWSVPPRRPGPGSRVLAASKRLGLEGIMAKRLDSPYVPGARSPAWLKVKNRPRQEFVIGGWKPGDGRLAGSLGSLQVGVREARGGPLRFAGGVGTGMSETERLRLRALLEERPAPDPFNPPCPESGVRFARPELVCEVEFAEWTHGGHVRQGSYLGLRDDKDPQDVVREAP